MGAAVASSADPPAPAPPPQVVVAPTSTPVVVAPSSGVYVAPTAVVAATPAAAAPSVLTIGTTVTVLPVGFTTVSVKGVQYYQSGPNWYVMHVGNNGAYFTVVKAP